MDGYNGQDNNINNYNRILTDICVFSHKAAVHLMIWIIEKSIREFALLAVVVTKSLIMEYIR